MKKMTKMLSVILTVAMMAAMLVACGSSDSKNDKNAFCYSYSCNDGSNACCMWKQRQ